MKIIKTILKKRAGKTKKSLGTTGAVVLVIATVISIFFGDVTFVGLIISAAILVVITGAVYYLLKWTDDLPDAF